MLPKVLLYILLLSMTTTLPGRIDNSATIVKKSSPLPQNATVVFSTKINYITFLCGTISQSADEVSPMVHSVAFFAKVNEDGELLWLRKYWGDEHNTLSTLLEVEGGYLLAGEAYSRYGSTCMMIKTDYEGNSQWMRYSGDGQKTEAKSITTVSAGTYAVDVVIKDWESHSIPITIKIDACGKILD